ncbi:MAG: DNA polymerase III subunit gamma/tau [Deltaproteobacteria bacterium]|nr:DNA polymerase III subunit gamma/tau [Deltaproteobacteria bacterium]
MTETVYQVLARKWRPQRFAELAGLEHIARTLQNAIRANRVGHAFLFTGTRGVGKTSAARILAKALNCRRGPAPEPCNQCGNCLAVTAGNAADVIEIDGASNRGVGEIRLLRDNVTYLPQTSPYKIYIIDEVHMLTPEAFNALLKTLEEPPAHIKFIMATTDAHKVPMTILSRCQRFDFGRLTGATIAATLTEIGRREDLTFAAGTVELLAREARGSMRDALSLLDQVRSYAGDKIAVEDLRIALGLIEARHNFGLLEKLVKGDLGGAIFLVDELERAGVDLKKFVEDFLFYLRDVLFLKISGELKKLLGIGADDIARLEPLLAERSLAYWQQLFDLWQTHYIKIKASQSPRLTLESSLVELGMARDLQPLGPLLERLEGHLSQASAIARPANPSVLSSEPRRVRETAAKAEVRKAASAPGQGAGSWSGERGPRPSSAAPEMPPEPPPFVYDDLSQNSSVSDEAGPTPAAAPSEFIAAPDPVAPPASFQSETVGGGDSSGSAGGKDFGSPQVLNQTVSPANLELQWRDFLVFVAAREARLGALLQRSRREVGAAERLRIKVAPHARLLLDNPGARSDLLALWAEFLGHAERVELELLELKPGGETSGPVRNGGGSRRPLPSKEEIFNDPSIRFISDRFGGRVVEIKARRP